MQAERWRLAREFHLELLEALGYPVQPGAETLEEEGLAVPASLARDGRPYLWAVEAPFTGVSWMEDESVLETSLPEQMPTSAEGARVPEETGRSSWTGPSCARRRRRDGCSCSEASPLRDGRLLSWRTQTYRVGDRFAWAVIGATKEGKLLYRHAYALLGVQGQIVSEDATRRGSVGSTGGMGKTGPRRRQ